RMFAETPKGDKVQVRGVEHQFDADENNDGVAARQRAGQADAKEQRRQQEIAMQRRHGGGKLQAPKSKLQIMSKSQVSVVRHRRVFGVWSFISVPHALR